MKLSKGFTLVELLVVIAIIGILSSVAVINLNSSRNIAKSVAVLNQLSDLSSVIYLCLDDNRGINCTDDLPLPGEYENFCSLGPVSAPPNDGVGYDPIELCAGIGVFWPNLEEHQWLYNIVTFSTSTNTWTINAQAPDLNPDYSITCEETGCTRNGF